MMPEPTVIALVRDLMFSSRITAEARAAGVTVRVLRDPAALAQTDATLLLVDLNQTGALEPAAAWAQAQPGREVVGFVSHVDVETIEAAKQLGIQHVLPRSAFVRQLPGLLKRE
jgi:DNA-binding NarL/FixJ family response regulator